ncbi:MAG: TonB-dependent receptor plug domain-containing protein, partial [Flavobacterium sp.]
MKGVRTVTHFLKISSNVRYVLLLLLLISSFQNAWGQNIQFKVSSNNKPIANVLVIQNDSIVAQTDLQGTVQIEKSKVADTSLRFVAEGYNEQFLNVQGNNDQINFEVILLEDESQLNEIVITAGRIPEHISTVPSSVTILNQQDIQSQSNITSNLSAILGNAVPGLGTSTNKATNSGQTLRGRAVLVLVDGIPQSTPLMNGARDLRTIDPLVIERIEVIKGATSIYGNGSGGGIINYITKKNKDEKAFGGQTVVGTSF